MPDPSPMFERHPDMALGIAILLLGVLFGVLLKLLVVWIARCLAHKA